MDHFSPAHKQETIPRILNKATPIAMIKTLAEAAHLSLMCPAIYIVHIHCMVSLAGDCKAEMWQEVVAI